MDEGTVSATDGTRDLERAVEDLTARLPEELGVLARVAFNYRWSWTPGADELFAAIDRERWELTAHNPVRLLSEAPLRSLHAATADPALVARARALGDELDADLARPGAAGPVVPGHPVAFLCAEYGVHVSLPVYSGGLGVLAGDILKEASDRALPLVAVGLLYRRGYFRQRIDAGGWQHEYWVDSDPDRLPAVRVTRADGEPLSIAVPIGDDLVHAAIWRVDVGRVPLFLLDTDLPANTPLQRWITARLYDGDPDTRLAQYALLGAGGIRALEALGIRPGVVHLNEGHAALAPLQLAGSRLRAGDSFERAQELARRLTVFTTHTPVPAGNDAYDPEQVRRTLGPLMSELGVTLDQLVALGRTCPHDESEPFGVTQAALRLSRSAGGVSRRHGDVARSMWHGLWPERPLEEVPIGHVTNGVHVPSWIGAPMRSVLDRTAGEGWMFSERVADAWATIERAADDQLWAARRAQRAELIEFLARRSIEDRLTRGDLPEYVTAAAGKLDPDVLTIGFARRVATYKRLDLLVRDPEFVLELLAGDRPVQFVLAGKAHPRDDEAKRSLQRVFGMKYAREVAERVVFLDDYDLATGARLVRGCDVWLNLPRPPLEASGTSGMKSVINGGLQLSVLDGWWAEGYDGHNGWAISGEIDDDPGAQDERHLDELRGLLRDQVLPAFYDRDEDGLPRHWLALMKRSVATLGPRFAATRMVGDYVAGPYRSADSGPTG